MSEILLTWLAKRLGVVMDFDPLYFGTYAADGTLVARLLHSYAIVTEEQVNFIEPSTTVANRLRNLRHLQTWLKYIGIQLDEKMINNIATEKGAEAVRLFYELYLCLENRQSLFIVTQRRGREINNALTSRFKVMNVPEIAVEDRKESFTPLSIPLAKDANLIEWYREKCKSLVDNIKAARQKFLHFSDEQEEFSILPSKQTLPETRLQREIDDVKYLSCSKDRSLKDTTYSELVKLQEHFECFQMKQDIDSKSAKSYISFIKKRSLKEVAHRDYKSEMQRIILTESWDKLEEKMQKDFDNMIAEKLLKQSQYGKQIVTKLYNIRNEKKIIIENKRRLDKLELQKRQEEVEAAIEMDKTVLEDYKYDKQFDKEMNLELHRRLYNERMQIKSDHKMNTCKNIVSDIVDLAVLTASFREEYDTDIIPNRMWADWKTLWLDSQPVFDQYTAVMYGRRPPSIEDQREQREEEDEKEDEEEDINDGDNGSVDENYAQKYSENISQTADILVDLDCKVYFELSGLWEQAVINTGQNREEDEKLTLLGYIIHRLLLMKYPLPPIPVAPELPQFTHAVAVIGLEDQRAISILEGLLNVQHIKILQLDKVINFCLEAFKEEMEKIEDIGNCLIRTSNDDTQALKLNSDSVTKNTVTNSNLSNETVDHSNSITENEAKEPPVQEKAVQTPRNIPQDDDVLSLRATLGKRAFETLSLGEQLDDALLMEMFVEYLKENANMKGWVLLNYPLRYSQAIQLEEKLLGIHLPHLEEDSESFEQVQQCIERPLAVDGTTKNRIHNVVESKLLPNTIPKQKPDAPKTYLTKYITLKKNKMRFEVFGEHEEGMINNESDPHEMSPLEKFYTSQEVFYTFYHDVFDFSTIKYLAKIITEDVKASPTTSIELFGENVKDLEIKFNAIEKKGRPPSCKKELISEKLELESSTGELKAEWYEVTEELQMVEESEKMLKIKQASNNFYEKGKVDETFQKEMGKDEINIKEPESSDMENSIDQRGKRSSENIDEKHLMDSPKDTGKSGLDIEMTKSEKRSIDPKPGEEGWQYMDLDIPEGMGICLATLWESVEEVFIKEWRNLNKANRINYTNLHPYMNFMRRYAISFIGRPDNKQNLVTEFQRTYNDIDADLRDDIDMKNELHCRVSELHSKLQEMCDERKNEAEGERRKVINKNWTTEEIVAILNYSVSATQTEINRCADTVLIVQDYYISMLKKLPQVKVMDKIKIPFLQLPENAINATKINSSKSIETTQRKFSSSAYMILGAEYNESIIQLLTECNQSKPLSTPFHDILLKIRETAKDYVKKLKNEALEVIRREEGILNQKETGKGNKKSSKKETGKGNKKSSKKETGKGKKSSKKDKKNIGTGAKEFEEQQFEPVTTVDKRLFQEWLEAINNETSRATFRIATIYERTILDMDALLEDVLKESSFARNEIIDRYNREVECVTALCNLLCKAIEEEIPIQQKLVLEKDKFYIRPNVLLYPPPPEPIPEPIEERINEEEFRICQLQCLMERLKMIAPTGIISERALVYMLEEIISCEPEGRTLPKIWYELRLDEVPKVLERIYGYEEYVDWKDFLIYGINFKFPTINELIELNKQFKSFDPEAAEVVSRDSYHCIRFHLNDYIPDDPQLRLRVDLSLELLFTMFEIEENKVNYSALLLYLCKDQNPQVGLAKTISLCTGKKVFADYGEYIAFNVLEEILIRQIHENQNIALSVGREVLSEVLKGAFQRTNDTENIELSRNSNEEVEHQIFNDGNDEQNPEEARDQEHLPEELNTDEKINSDVNIGLLEQKLSSNTQYETYSSSRNTLQGSDLSLRLKDLEFYNTEYAFRAPLDLLLSVFSVCLPWHIKRSEFMDGKSLLQDLKAVFDELSHGDDTIYIHQFLEHDFIKKLLSKIHKFQSYDIAEEIKSVIMSRNSID